MAREAVRKSATAAWAVAMPPNQATGYAGDVARHVGDAIWAWSPDWDKTRRIREVRTEQSDLLRCIFGDPFRPQPPLEPALLSCNGGVIAKLAQAAYDERLLPQGGLDNGRLAVLADSLEEGGCTDAALLGHLRSLQAHVRGCFALDTVLGNT
jgi:hypothetical protein